MLIAHLRRHGYFIGEGQGSGSALTENWVAFHFETKKIYPWRCLMYNDVSEKGVMGIVYNT